MLAQQHPELLRRISAGAGRHVHERVLRYLEPVAVVTCPSGRCIIRHVNAREFRAPQAWGADELARLDDATVRLHWTDQPYAWHVNDGVEVFAVVDGEVDMHVRVAGEERVIRLRPGDVLRVDPGDEHVAHPIGEARILVVERAGSI